MTLAMWNKAQALIHADCHASWRQANILPNGRPRKRHRPYSVSPRAQAMVDALGKGDADLVAALIRDWGTLNDPA